MGLMQKAVETYDKMSHLVGKEIEGKETLAPIGHIIAKPTILITIDSDGNFVSATAVDKKIPIPVTEASLGRTSSTIAPHCLCDQICYVCKNGNKSDILKSEKYISQLEEWVNSEYTHPKIIAILKYVKAGMIKQNLLSCRLLKLDDKGVIKNNKEWVCWSVLGVDFPGAVWTDENLQKLFSQFYLSKISNKEKSLCMISGKETICTQQNLKGVFSLSGNAKIISSNDKANFTYKGRFMNDSEAFEIGYEQSQKGHNALKWLIANQGVPIGSRVFVCWNPDGIQVPAIHLPFLQTESKPAEPSDYKQQLFETLQLCKNTLKPDKDVIVAAFDAATTGRLSIAYYSEFKSEDFFDRLEYWDETCCWFNRFGISSPYFSSIVKYAFGTQRGDNENARIEIDDRIEKQLMQRLIFCRLEKQIFPRDIMLALFNKSKNLQIYSRNNRENLLFTACAAIKKYHYDKFKEEWEMSLEKDKKDRSYQFGRLLAVLEKIEADVLKDRNEDRVTSALRLQPTFVQRPAQTEKIIVEGLRKAYYPRLKTGQRAYYEALIGEIHEKLSQFFDDNYNKPLTETYLLGYYLQKNELYKKKETKENKEVNENE